MSCYLKIPNFTATEITVPKLSKYSLIYITGLKSGVHMGMTYSVGKTDQIPLLRQCLAIGSLNIDNIDHRMLLSVCPVYTLS